MSFPKRNLSRPKSGYRFILIGVSFSLFATAGCSDSPTQQHDSWRLSPPELIGTTGDGKSIKQSAKQQLEKGIPSEQNVLDFNLESYLKFSKVDRDLRLDFESRCDTAFHSGNVLTAEVVSLARMVPPQILGDMPPASTCQIEISVTNPVGSVHRFKLQNVRLRANSSEEKLKTSNQTLDLTLKHEPLRLVCGSWWSEETTDSVNAALSLESRIWSLATMGTVSGRDDRKQRFRPICSLFQMHGDSGMALVKFTQLQLPGLETTLTKKIVLSPHSHYTFLREPLIEWHLQNTSARSQIILVSRRNQNLKMSYANAMPSYPFGWSKMISVPFEFRFLSGQMAVESADGTFIELPAGQILTMQLKLNLDAHCMTSFDKLGTPFLHFELGTPITYAVLDQDLTLSQINLVKEKAALNNQIEQRTFNIFSSQVLEFSEAQSGVKDGGIFSEAERRLGPGLQMPHTGSSQCFHGQMLAGSPQWKRPFVD